MPLAVSNRCIETVIAHYEYNQNYRHLLNSFQPTSGACKRIVDALLAWQIFETLRTTYMGQLQHRQLSSSLIKVASETVSDNAQNSRIINKSLGRNSNRSNRIFQQNDYICIEATEDTPLLLSQQRQQCSQLKSSKPEHRLQQQQQPYNTFVESAFAPAYETDDSNSGFYRDTHKVDFFELPLMTIGLIFIIGLTIAVYLLAIQSRMPSLKFSLDLVNHDVWSAVALPLGTLLNHTNVMNVIITQTGGDKCLLTDSCITLIKELQLCNGNTSEIAYNFLIGGDGLTYEIRGWDYESGIAVVPQNSTLVIGLIGNFTKSPPSTRQLQSALSLIQESVRRHKLRRYFKVYGLRNVTISTSDGAALFQQIGSWPRFITLLQIL